MAARDVTSSTPPISPPSDVAGGNPAAAELIERWIEPDPHKPGPGDVRLRTYFVHVWALVGHQQATGGDAVRVSYDYGVPVQAVEAALAYYQIHRDVIDARLRENDA